MKYNEINKQMQTLKKYIRYSFYKVIFEVDKLGTSNMKEIRMKYLKKKSVIENSIDHFKLTFCLKFFSIFGKSEYFSKHISKDEMLERNKKREFRKDVRN